MIFSSPAKINRGFNVLKKRSDGFHDIETAFQFLDWGDEIDFNFNVVATVSNVRVEIEDDYWERIQSEITLEKDVSIRGHQMTGP